ncbi:hypothetical protein J3R30DRAFT_3431548 [Lentinula aciculospora]|uniref:Uncharacterized protein n=1 Tax=Lentinula aciculospora TaxID=153920 RepID=A0A9W9DWR7_9AGAR|nr:hypothetical protein J3R30DRAFT_3431548 [Lentinula aciculospora]
MQPRFSFILLGLAVTTYSRPIDSPLQVRDDLSTTLPKATPTSSSNAMNYGGNPTTTIPPPSGLSETAAGGLSSQNTGHAALPSATVARVIGSHLSKRFLPEVANGLTSVADEFQNSTRCFEDVKHKYTKPFSDAGDALHDATSDVNQGFENIGNGMKDGVESTVGKAKNNTVNAVYGMENKTTGVVEGAIAGGKAGWNGSDSSS